MGSGRVAGSGAGVRGSCEEVEVDWEQFEKLSKGGRSGGSIDVQWIGRNSVAVLGPLLGAHVVSEIDAGRLPRFRPVKK
jgi:hypothetical protein